MAEVRQIGVVNVAFTFAEANQTLGGLRTRAVILESFLDRAKLNPQTRDLITAAHSETKEAEGRLSAALMGDPDDGWTESEKRLAWGDR